MTKSLLDADLSIIDFLPESIADDPEVLAIARALDPELREVAASIIEATILPRIADVPEDILNELAWAFNLNSLQIWDDATIDGKRALLANIFAIRKKSGTRFSVRRVFTLLSVVGEVIEWWEEDAAPYTYRIRITIDDVGITRSQWIQMAELTHRFAPTRSRLRELAGQSDRRAPLFIYPAPQSGRLTTIGFGG